MNYKEARNGGISRTIMQMGVLELAVDADWDSVTEQVQFTLSMGTGFGSGNQASVNIETPMMSEAEFRVVLGQLNDSIKVALEHFNGPGANDPGANE